MVLPILIRSVEESLRAVPRDYRRATAALGFSKTSAIMHVIVPAAIPGVVVGFALGLGRAIAETAALIFTSGYVDRMPESVHDSGRALAIHIYDLSMNIPGGDKSAYGSSLVLIALLLVINVVSAKIAHHWMHKRIKLI
jgi:phosphate transport system permease protein